MPPYLTIRDLMIAGSLDRLAIAANDNDINLYRSTRSFICAGRAFLKRRQPAERAKPGKPDQISDGSR